MLWKRINIYVTMYPILSILFTYYLRFRRDLFFWRDSSSRMSFFIRLTMLSNWSSVTKSFSSSELVEVRVRDNIKDHVWRFKGRVSHPHILRTRALGGCLGWPKQPCPRNGVVRRHCTCTSVTRGVRRKMKAAGVHLIHRVTHWGDTNGESCTRVCRIHTYTVGEGYVKGCGFGVRAQGNLHIRLFLFFGPCPKPT